MTARWTKLVVGGAAAATLLSGCGFNSAYDVPLPGGADLGSDPFTVTIEFRDVLDLVPESAVKVDDVTVGKVSDISLDGWTAVVTIQVNDEVELPDNAGATIRQTSVLGEKFVSLETPARPAPGELGEGDDIPLAATGRNPEIEEVFGALSLVLNGGGLSQVETITRELNRALGGREPEIRSLLNRLDRFVGVFDRSREELVTALRRVNRLGVRTREQTDAITDAIDTLPAALRSLEAQRGDLVDALVSLDELGDAGTNVIRRSREDTVDNLEDLQPILANLSDAGTTLVDSLRILPSFPYPDALVGETPEEAETYAGGEFLNGSITFDIDMPRALGVLSSDEYAEFVRRATYFQSGGIELPKDFYDPDYDGPGGPPTGSGGADAASAAAASETSDLGTLLGAGEMP